MLAKQKEQKAGNVDVDIGASSIVSLVLSPEGREGFLKAASSPEPVKALAMILSQVIEMAITGLEKAKMGVSPSVWLAPNGALADASRTLIAFANKNQIPLDESVMDAVAKEVSMLLTKRGESMAQGQPQGGQPPQGEPQPPAGPAPMPGGAV